MLKTPRLLIRPGSVEDAQDLHAVYGDAETMRYWSCLPDQSVQETSARLQQMAAARPPLTYFVFEHEGRAIGAGGVHERNEVGFILNKSHWRQGFVREAMNALTPYLFKTLATTQLTADADPRNEASIACLKSLGFVETGRASNTFCVGGEWSDSVYFALQRPS